MTPTIEKECGHSNFQNCKCLLEQKVDTMATAFTKGLFNLPHEDFCPITECGRCGCSTQEVLNVLAKAAKDVVDEARLLIK